MFTGIIEEIGTVQQIRRGSRSLTIEIRAAVVLEGTRTGDSIATDGVCLTVTRTSENGFFADVMPETMERTALKYLQPGSRVNLERALSPGGRLGGHIVTGHIDGTGRIVSVRRDDNALWLTVEAEPSVLRYVVEKGSIAIDGVSLTVAKAGGREFSVSLIPHTLGMTTLHGLREGDRVNLENDIIAKYVEKLASRPQTGGLTAEFLHDNGF